MIVEGDSAAEANGVSTATDARAAFLAGESEEAEKPAEVADDDSDLEDDDESEAEVSDEEDPDADLEDDDEEGAEEDDDTKKRIDKVQRTEKRAREQLKAERTRMEADLEAKAREYKAGFDAELAQWKPRIETAEKFEKMASRANVDPVSVLKALGVSEDHYEHIGQVFYTLAQMKSDDPEKAKKARAAAAQLVKQGERDAEIADLKKRLESREQTESQREQQAAADREVDAFISSVTKAATDKTPLAKTFLKNDADAAREELQIVAFRLAKETGRLPDAKAVMIAFEKHQRAKDRKSVV